MRFQSAGTGEQLYSCMEVNNCAIWDLSPLVHSIQITQHSKCPVQNRNIDTRERVTHPQVLRLDVSSMKMNFWLAPNRRGRWNATSLSLVAILFPLNSQTRRAPRPLTVGCHARITNLLILPIKNLIWGNKRPKFGNQKNHFRNQTDKFWKSKIHFRNQTDKFWFPRGQSISVLVYLSTQNYKQTGKKSFALRWLADKRTAVSRSTTSSRASRNFMLLFS